MINEVLQSRIVTKAVWSAEPFQTIDRASSLGAEVGAWLIKKSFQLIHTKESAPVPEPPTPPMYEQPLLKRRKVKPVLHVVEPGLLASLDVKTDLVPTN